MMKRSKIDSIVIITLACALSGLSWYTHSLYIAYAEYRDYAHTELNLLNDRVLDAQVRLIEMKSACNALLPVHPDSGNDFSR